MTRKFVTRTVVALTLSTLALLTVAPTAPAAAAEPTATPIDRMKIKEGFKVELLYTVPKDTQGSWVSMTTEPKGRLYVSDQYGKLYRVTPPGINGATEVKVEPVPVDIGEAQGMVWAFDSLYVVVNRGGKYKSGLYRLTDTNGDDTLDKVVQLREFFNGGGEHGPHAVLRSPDGKTITVVCGDQTPLTEVNDSRVPKDWDEDNLLPRVYGRGFMKGTPAPGGWICKTDPEGKNWELIATGFRNEYDAAYDWHGELFTYDADMEWDMNTPWYRPTRVNHVVSGAEFGWRNGGGKWPAYYPDSLGSIVDIGPGSPTGVTFGYGAKFPKAYRNALFICDWSYGKMYAVHITPDGATYKGQAEEFITGVPLPLTDIAVNPMDGAMYFTIGGRKVQSGLYRVTYTKDVGVIAPGADEPPTELQKIRRDLEALHRPTPGAVDKAWPYLGQADRHIRFAARIALEHQPVDQWRDRALAEKNTDAALTALLALARQYERADKRTGAKNAELDTPAPRYDGSDPKVSADRRAAQQKILSALDRFDLTKLDERQQIDLARVYEVTFVRTGQPDDEARKALIAKFDAVYPTGEPLVDLELTQLMVYLQAPSAAAKGVALLEQAPTQQEQIAYAKTLRLLLVGWDEALARKYFAWFDRAAGYNGGASFEKFVEYIRNGAIANLSADEKEKLKDVLSAKPKAPASPFALLATRKPVKNYTVAELAPIVEKGLTGRNFNRGRQLFGSVGCFACHRYGNEGGAVGPDLTGVAGRFSPRDLLESVIEPSKEISDQYGAVIITMDDGSTVYGRIVNLSGDTYRVNPDMLDPKNMVGVDRRKVKSITPSPVSMMPPGLLNVLEQDEVLDLVAYLLSRGDRKSPMFK
ncbi:MAG: c-type cytochrome [Phycisphaera sp.]|nr:c-type cytochrome [Phycisphaera sp.]